jgi:type II secretory pathway pseudopilin PulG
MRARLHSERGFALTEALIAVAILGMTLVVFIAGLSTGLLTTGAADRLSTAHQLARSQIEYTKNDVYSAAPHTYPTVVPPGGYGVTSLATGISGGDANVELISVQVSKDGNVVYTLEGYKVNR